MFDDWIAPASTMNEKHFSPQGRPEVAPVGKALVDRPFVSPTRRNIQALNQPAPLAAAVPVLVRVTLSISTGLLLVLCVVTPNRLWSNILAPSM